MVERNSLYYFCNLSKSDIISKNLKTTLRAVTSSLIQQKLIYTTELIYRSNK